MPTIGAEPAPILRLAALAAAALALGAGPSPAGGVLAALRQHQVTAVGFVNENKLEPTGERAARLALLRSWLDAGHDLGNHTYSHPDLQRVPLEESQRDVLRGEPGIRELLAARGRAPRWFRRPLTHTGPSREVRTRLEAFLAERGYAVAPFSIENAASLGELLERLAGRGHRFVALDEALADGAWRTPDEYLGPRGPSWRLYLFRVAKSLPLGLEREPDPPKWVLDLYREAR